MEVKQIAPPAPGAERPTLDPDGNFVLQGKKAAGEICQHLKLPYKWPDAAFCWLESRIQGICFTVRETVRKREALAAALPAPHDLSKCLRDLSGAWQAVSGDSPGEKCMRGCGVTLEDVLDMHAGDRHASAERVRRETIDEVVYMLQGVQTDAINRVDRGNIIDRVRLLRALPPSTVEKQQ